MEQTPENLNHRIKEAQARQEAEEHKGKRQAQAGNTAAAQAFRVATDLLAALFVGGFAGYWLDRWLGTKPWGMVILFFLGFAAGFLNIYRSQTGQDFKIGFKEEKKDKDGSKSP